MSDSEQKALMLYAEAEKKVKSAQGFFATLFGGSSRVEEATDLYVRAANMFKMCKRWDDAGNAFTEAAQLQLKAGSRHDAATNYVDAGNAYKKVDSDKAVSALLRAVEIYTDMGRFTIAAKHHVTIAEIYENDVIDVECKGREGPESHVPCPIRSGPVKKAIHNYEQAADYFKGEESNSSANKCLLKVAYYAALLEEYDKAIDIYERVGSQSLESSLLKYSAREHFFRAALCHLCVDAGNARAAIAKYEEIYPAFQDSRDSKLVKQLCHHVDEQSVDGFTEAVKEYDSVSRLDQWYTTILLRIKKKMSSVPDLR